MYIHNSVEYKIKDDLMNFEIECLTIEVKIGMSKQFLVTSLYSPHNTTDHLNKIDSLIACIDTENKESIIIGDTNCDFIKPVQSPLSDLLTTSATDGTFSRPSTKHGLILIGLELNTNARESFEHC